MTEPIRGFLCSTNQGAMIAAKATNTLTTPTPGVLLTGHPSTTRLFD
jgi:hypothetical protein